MYILYTRLPWQVHERGTVYRQLSAQPPHRLLPLQKNLNHFCLYCHSVCDNVYRLLTMFSALAAVCTVWLRYRNWLNYITLHYILTNWRHPGIMQWASSWGRPKRLGVKGARIFPHGEPWTLPLHFSYSALTLLVGRHEQHSASNSQTFFSGIPLREPDITEAHLWKNWPLSLSLFFNGHFPGENGLAAVYWSKGWWKRWWQMEL